MTKRILLLLSLVLLLALSLSPAVAAAKNVIFMIGDGMGISQVGLARMCLPEGSSGLNMDTMPYTGFVRTYSANATVTDSAAAGTALATGHKTNNGMIGMLPDGTSVENIREAAAKLGKATGLVTTTTISHATPASFGAHVPNRGDEASIAVQLLDNKVDVLLGGGKGVFSPSGSKDGRDLLAEAKTAGYAVVDTRDALLKAKGTKILGLFQDGALSTEAPEPTLAELTVAALDVLSQEDEGFFLMVEGGQIDWKCHDNNAEATLKQTLDFDAAVGEALAFARSHRDTLVIVTADHETGGMGLNGGGTKDVKWTSGGHTAVDVPIFAYGSGAYRFRGVLENTDVPKRIAQLWRLKDFGTLPAK